MKPSARLVLDRLRIGPQTTHDLGEHCGYRFGARVEELRNDGYVIEVQRLTRTSSRYTLVSEPERFGDNDTPTRAADEPHGPEDTPDGLFDLDAFRHTPGAYNTAA